MKKNFLIFMLASMFVFPASTDYKLKDYSFGSGGVGNATSSNYSLNAISGEAGGGEMSGTNYKIGAGLHYTNQANVPLAPVFDNPGNYYNKLRIIINPSGNPGNAKFAIAISDDNFTTTKYIQNDNAIGSSLGLEDYQSYALWGGASGFEVLGLSAGTSYAVKAKAITGKFTETGYGPMAVAITTNPSLSFDIDVSAVDLETDTPYGVSFGNLSAGAVNSSAEKIWIDFSTNGENGGKVFISGNNGGLKSASNSHLISGITGNLDSVAEGFGAQSTNATQLSGGPLAISGIYSQVDNNVGIVDQVFREIFSSTGPIMGGRGSFVLKAKSSTITPAATDYTETFTMVASGEF